MGFARPVILSLLLGATAGAQLPSASWEAYRRDSIAWVRDSARIDSVSRTIPADSLRRLYRALTSTTQPARVVQAMMCESYRLKTIYQHAALVAEDRIQAEEWPESKQAGVRRALVAWGTVVSSLKPWPDTLPRRISQADDRVCRTAKRIPRSLSDLILFRPERPDAPPAGSMEWFWRSGSSGPAEGKIADRALRDGYARLGWRGYSSLSLEVRDLRSLFTIVLVRQGDEYLRPGVYPIINGSISSVSNNVFVLSELTGGRSVNGFVTVDRADTTGAEGRIELVQHRNADNPMRSVIPPDSIYDVPISIRFRATYDREHAQENRLWSRPVYPHPWIASRIPDR